MLTNPLMNVEDAISGYLQVIRNAVNENGEAGKHSAIRSSEPINFIHELVKADLIRKKFDSNRINPNLGKTKPELKLSGFLKAKKQDIAVIPDGITPKNETLKEGLLQGTIDKYGKEFTERTLTINVRSQLSSLAKNFDTLYERTIAEAINFRLRCPKMVLGEVYMIPVKEVCSKGVVNNTMDFLNKVGSVEKYIKSFQALNGRKDEECDFYKYDRVCLLIVDFSCSPAKVYQTTQELIDDGFLDKDSDAKIEPLNWDDFTNDLINIYEERFSAIIST